MSFILCCHHLRIHSKIVRLLWTWNKSWNLLHTMFARHSFVPSNTNKSMLLILIHEMQYLLNTETHLSFRSKTYLRGLTLRVNTIGSTCPASRSRVPNSSAGAFGTACTGGAFFIAKRTPLKILSSSSRATICHPMPRHAVMDAPVVQACRH